MFRTGAVATAGVLALGLGLTACGGDDDADAASGDGGPDKADIRVWLNGTDTPDAARDWLKKTFEDQHPGSTLTIEQQEWEGLVEKLTTSLSSDSETPDVVEVGNTQAPTFTAAGAFADVSDDLADWGGDDLLQGFVDNASVDGKAMAVPYYAGSKYIFYRKDLMEQAGIEVPTTMDEFVQAAIDLKKANPQPANFSGFWFPGQDWRNGVAFVWDAGGDLATEQDGSWQGALSSPESVAGLETVQKLMTEASGAPKDGNEENPQTPFCAGEVGMLSAPGWVKGLIEDPETGCPDMVANLGVFALPGSDGSPAPVLLGGSDIAISAKSQNQDLAKDVVGLMLSDDYQKMMAEAGLTPAKSSLSGELGSDEYAEATIAAASDAKLTPAAPGWAEVEGSRVLEDLFVDIAKGGDVQELATAADEKITEQLGG
ncbi:extracellular solute-binding protein [Nocardioides anomalus]|uniref:Extracellular solute-binding protein n=1 Tax=Nocardioides anomalus TaxID=2712223 RepID=A0A6G6WJS6_9ACTN|nr:extracellular solute-binding protein [Nocardioides anomalus]QIG45393.1 extracellular solute-binding protein [Nocardioides anomalus]